jgi:hypothetical protein
MSLAAAGVPLLLLSPSNFIGGSSMKKNEFSEAASNLLIFGSVSLALAPFVLGDRLILIVTGLMKEGGVMIDQFSNYVSWLIS